MSHEIQTANLAPQKDIAYEGDIIQIQYPDSDAPYKKGDRFTVDFRTTALDDTTEQFIITTTDQVVGDDEYILITKNNPIHERHELMRTFLTKSDAELFALFKWGGNAEQEFSRFIQLVRNQMARKY